MIGSWIWIACVAAATSACGRSGDQPAPPQQTQQTPIQRGEYLVTTGGCNDCHTTKKMGERGPELDHSKLLAGHIASEQLPRPPTSATPWAIVTTPTLTAWAGPWGTSYTANLTPDLETGIGSWTEEQFKQTLKTGKHLGIPTGREILPPMPWFNYAVMTDEDFTAVFAYLRSIPPVKNAVPQPVSPSDQHASR